uniref:Eukaryotic translation initiation factor 3 subunit G n=1 Tax=Lotharella oceanica TaxID=641309 RepID=A0A7S2TMD6_9EUKA|mmetsp:Transcript_19324/g.36375  ORF Transcript_19324/g.36375 Transcript_19324/m.36375 type:complete len:287 (+) Transcript_19324:31-891(+)
MSAKDTAGLPPRTETEPDEKGIKIVTEYRRGKNKELIKVTSRVQVSKEDVRVSKRVLERKEWKRFGRHKDKSDKEDMITFLGEPFVLEMKQRSTNYYVEDDTEVKRRRDQISVVKCKFCGEAGHWTLKCPKRKPGESATRPMPGGPGGPGGAGMISRGGGGAPGKYVPMHKRIGAVASKTVKDRDSHSLRVTNISEDATEDDLRDLFRRCGELTRVFLARDRQTGKSRGFAFVSFQRADDAERAIELLNGYGYDNLILHVEKAKPREPKKDDDKPSGARSNFKNKY